VSRQLGDERGRYRRRTLRDRAAEAVDWVRTHRSASAVLALFIGVMAIGVVAPARSAMPTDLEVGDCLYIRTTASMAVGPDARPIGPPSEVEAVLMSGGAEQAGCGTSHGHEVAAVVHLGTGQLPGASGEALRDSIQPACDAAFAAYVGKDAVTSLYETFAVVPGGDQFAAGLTDAICLVARRDGQWMTHAARGSGE
jgi:hypothetical protein